MQRIRVILADDHKVILDALKNLLEPEFQVVGTFGDGHSLVEEAPALKPNVIVLDVGMPTMNGLSAGQRLRQVLPHVKLVYLTMNQDPDLAAEAFRLGAKGYLLKTSAGSELVDAIRAVFDGRIDLDVCMFSLDDVFQGAAVSRRRSRATGCRRARSRVAVPSSSISIRLIFGSSRITSSASSGFLSTRERTARRIEDSTIPAI